MAKRVILAVAGAGKTYHICHNIDKNKKNLILAYTHENIKNIRKELINAFGCIPDLTTVITFDAFVYRYLILPYEPSILKFFDKKSLKTKGITLNKPEPKTVRNRPNAENVKELNKAFSNFWIIPHNFNSIVAFWLRKIKFKFRFFCYFFSFDKFFK